MVDYHLWNFEQVKKGQLEIYFNWSEGKLGHTNGNHSRITASIRTAYQGLELLLTDQIELVDEKVEVFVTRVAVGFGTDGHKSVEVMDVDVDEDPEESGQDLLARGQKRLGKGHVVPRREYLLVVDLAFSPVHEKGDVLGGGQRHRLLVGLAVGPQVFILVATAHSRTRLLCAVVAHRAVDQVDSVEEVDHMDGDPIAQVLA